MPKIKKYLNDENECPMTTKMPKRVPFKFDVKQILKERKIKNKFWERSAELDKQMKVVDELFQKEVNRRVKANENNEVPDIPKFGFVIFDCSKYNTNFCNNLDSDVSKSYLQLFNLMSIEENEFEATIYFHKLVDANWSPAFNDVQNILFNWGTDINTLTNKPLLKCQVNNEGKIKYYCFELVFIFITQCIQKNNNTFSVDDLLTLAKFAATIYLDHYYGPRMINVIKEMFRICIETAFHNDDETDILSFSQELYSNHEESQLLKMVVDLFLPLQDQIMKKIYTYLTFKLYKRLIGKTNDLNTFPSSINDWFVQDLVNANYFRQNPKKLLHSLIYLMEHVVVVFDLYKNEEKLSNMYDFFYFLVKPTGGLSQSSIKLVNILDQWRLTLFRLHVHRQSVIFDNV